MFSITPLDDANESLANGPLIILETKVVVLMVLAEGEPLATDVLLIALKRTTILSVLTTLAAVGKADIGVALLKVLANY